MKRNSLVAAVVTIALASPAAAQEAVVTPEMLSASLQRSVSLGAPGLSAAIATRRGIVWTGVAGAADIVTHVPIDEASIFGIGSITKVFVAVTILQLVQERRLRLSDTPDAILGGTAMKGVANAHHATVAQLLGHTAGIPSWEDEPAWIRRGRGERLDPVHRWGKIEALDYIRGRAPLAAPGAAFSYSNSGYTLLGLMIEKITGNPATVEIRRRVLVPLGLRDTYFEGFEREQPARVPRRYHYATKQFREVAGMAPTFVTVGPDLIDVGATNLSDEWTAGAMISSPRDLVTFAIALRDGRLLKPASLAFMEQWAPALPGMRVGHGLFSIDTAAGPAIGHTGGVLGFSASLWWLEKGDVAVAVMANGSSMHAGKTPPNAATVGVRSDFARLAACFAAQQK